MKPATMRRISVLESAIAPNSGPCVIVLIPGGSSTAIRRYVDGIREWNARSDESQGAFEARAVGEAEYSATSSGRVALIAAMIG